MWMALEDMQVHAAVETSPWEETDPSEDCFFYQASPLGTGNRRGPTTTAFLQHNA